MSDRSLGVVSAVDATTQISFFSSFSRKSPMGGASQLYPTQFAKKKLTFICIRWQIILLSGNLFIQILILRLDQLLFEMGWP
jgi:hypothetical protein